MALSAVVCALAVPSASAAPVNDAFAAATVLSGASPSATGSNTGATRESLEPQHNGRAEGASVWWRWSPPGDGTAYISTCGSSLRSGTEAAVIGAYAGTALGALATKVPIRRLTCADDVGNEKLQFNVGEGENVRIAVDGRYAFTTVGQGPLDLQVDFSPENDPFHGPTLIDSGSTLTGTSEGARREAGEPAHAGATGGSVWWYHPAAEDGILRIDTCASDFDATVAVYRGDEPHALTAVAFSADGCAGPNGARVEAPVVAGELYRIAVVGETEADEGRVSITARNRPANDDLAAARTLIGPTVTAAAGRTRFATAEDGEPGHGGGTPAASAWWTYTPDFDGPVTIDLCDSSFDTVLAVYTGSAVGALTGVAADDNGCRTGPVDPQRGSRLTFAGERGVPYRIAVSGAPGRFSPTASTGDVALDLRQTLAGDDFADAKVLETGVLGNADTRPATEETGEPDHGGPGRASVWHRWTAPSSGRYTVDACRVRLMGEDPLLGIYTGSGVGALTAVVKDDDGCSGATAKTATGHYGASARFTATAGTTYRIAVDSHERREPDGRTTVALRVDPTPANDDRADAPAPVGGLPATFTGTSAGATRDGANVSEDFPGTTWHRWTAPSSGRIVIDTCSDRTHFVTLRTIDDVFVPGELSAVCGVGQQRAYRVTEGETYYLAVQRRAFFDAGRYSVRLRPTPANDQFADAHPLAPGDEVAFDLTTATSQTSEPAHEGPAALASVWYRFTAPDDGSIEVDTCGATGLTRLAAYTGDGSLTEVTATRATCGFGVGGRRMRVPVAAGQTLSIAVDAAGGSRASGELRLRYYGPLMNDAFASSAVLPPSGMTDGHTVGATREVGEPFHGASSTAGSVWYRWVAPRSGAASFWACAQDRHAVAIYRGAHLDALQRVQGGTIDPAEHFCHGLYRLFTEVEAGDELRIAVQSDNAPAGAFRLGVALRPLHDTAPAALALSGPDADVTGDNIGATKQAGDDELFGRGVLGTLWYAWTPAAGGRATVEVCESSFDPVVTVATGDAAAPARLVAADDVEGCGDGRGARVAFDADAGTRYLLGVAGSDATFVAKETFGQQSVGTFRLRLDGPGTATPPPGDGDDGGSPPPAGGGDPPVPPGPPSGPVPGPFAPIPLPGPGPVGPAAVDFAAAGDAAAKELLRTDELAPAPGFTGLPAGVRAVRRKAGPSWRLSGRESRIEPGIAFVNGAGVPVRLSVKGTLVTPEAKKSKARASASLALEGRTLTLDPGGAGELTLTMTSRVRGALRKARKGKLTLRATSGERSATYSRTVKVGAPRPRIGSRAVLDGRRLVLELACRELQTCRGTAEVKAGKRRVVKRAIRVAAGRTEDVRLTIPSSARTLVKAGTSLKVTLVAADATKRKATTRQTVKVVAAE